MESAAGHLIIAADCGVQIGTGHVMRCLALAQSWKHFGGSATFLVPEGSPGIEDRIRAEGMRMEVLASDRFADAATDRARNSEQGVVVLDGYEFTSQHQAALTQAGRPVLVIDDYGQATEYPVGWILNQSPCAGAEKYARRGNKTQLLLGAPYALLREQFLPWLGWKRSFPEKASKVLITIGGSDPANLSAQVLESLTTLSRTSLQVVLVAGTSNPHLEALQSAARASPHEVRIVHNALDMPALMAWADVAVSGAGGTSNELCYMGLPSLLFVIAANQGHVAEDLSRLSAVVHCGEARNFESRNFVKELSDLIDSRERRERLSTRARELVDGLGANRVRAALLGRELKLRIATQTDEKLLFAWANDPIARQASFHSAPIIWEEHQHWFAEKLRDARFVIYVGESRSGEPVGQVRFELHKERAILSVVVAPTFRGQGWGRELIWFSTRTLARTGFTGRIEAFVKPENQASVRLFESAGFRRVGNETVAGQPALLFTWTCASGVHAN